MEFNPHGRALDQDKTCNLCRRILPNEGPDPCIGILPGVDYACCGHGKNGYISFMNGIVIRFNCITDIEMWIGDELRIKV